MYLGRIVAVGRTQDGRNTVMYRVSSRSFPNREAVQINDRVAILPRAGFEDDLKKNPYITYNCLLFAGDYAVVSNGSQTDPIAEKIRMGMPVRDAITLGLLAMDYEKDSLDTPRIVSVCHKTLPVGYLGIVRKDAVLVREFAMEPGVARYISTYECNAPCDTNVDTNFDAACENCAVKYVVDGGVFAGFENPVTSAAALATEDGFALSTFIC
jgi:IMP cyclohydrolase